MPEVGETIGGRYELEQQLGQGGTGVVFRAIDPELDREVAIKVVRPEVTQGGHETSEALGSRLRRESRALASLSHPNVVAVYDVLTDQGPIHIVMELVRGPTLRQWVRDERRPWAELWPVFREAGEGLHAAHEAGLVHRDFKPANVLLGADGRVRVLDFGLARPPATVDDARITDSHPSLPIPSRDSSDSVTRTGLVIGTPAYMAPEQMTGAPVDARADQFAFCVSLYEALWDQRPFEGRTLEHRRRAIAQGPHIPSSGAPARVREAIARGLAAHPEDRFADMRALLSTLDSAGKARPGRAVLALGAGAALAVTAAFNLSERPCDEASALHESLSAAQSSAASAFAGTDHPFAAREWTTTRQRLSEYADGWAAARRHACQQRAPALTACLEDSQRRFDALLEVLGEADDDVVVRAQQLVGDLPAPDACREDAAAPQTAPPELRAQLARVVTLHEAGRYADAQKAAAALYEAAEAASSRPMQIAARYEQGALHQELSEFAEAEQTLSDCYFEANEAGDHRTAARAATLAVAVVGGDLRRKDESQTWVRHAQTSLDRFDATPVELGSLERVQGIVAMRVGERDAALARFRAAHAHFESALGANHVDTVDMLNSIGIIQQEQGQLDEALMHHRHALEVWTDALGPQHPRVGSAHQAIANTHALANRPAEAIAEYQNAIANWERSLGPGHLQVAMAHYNIGRLHQLAGDADAALESYQTAIALLDENVGPDHITTAMPVHNIGALYHELGRLEPAQAHLERSLRVFERNDADPLFVAINRYELAKVMHELGEQPARVTELLVQARGGFEGGGEYAKQQIEDWDRWVAENRPELR